MVKETDMENVKELIKNERMIVIVRGVKSEQLIPSEHSSMDN